MAIVSSIILAFIVIVNWLHFRDARYPPFLHASIWFLLSVLLSFPWKYLNILSYKVYILVVLSAISFSVGAWLSTYGHKPKLYLSQVKKRSLPPQSMLIVMIAIVVAVIPLWVKRAGELAQYGPFESFLRNIRVSRALIVVEGDVTYGGFYYGILGYTFTISVFITLNVLVYYLVTKKARFMFIISLLTSSFFAILSTGRTSLFVILTAVSGIIFILRQVRTYKLLLLYVISGVAAFLIIGMVMHKAGAIGQSPSEVIKDAQMSFVSYMLGPVAALDHLLNNPQEHSMGTYTLRFFYRLSAFLGAEAEVTPLVRDYVGVPFPINVYTVADPYYRDFGLPGVIIAQFIFGLIHGFLYRRATLPQTSATSVMLYAISLYPLVFQFFQDQYMSLASTWAQYLLMFLVVYFIRSIRANRTRKRQITSSIVGRDVDSI